MNWYHITPGTSARATLVNLIGEMGVGRPASEFIAELGESSIVELRVDCPGGDVRVGLELYDALQGRDVTATITGRWGSACIAPVLAAHTITCNESSRILIHPPANYVFGCAAELRHAAYVLEEDTARIEQILIQRTGRDPATVRNWLTKDTWFSADEALQFGLVDVIFTPAPLTAQVLESRPAEISAGAQASGTTQDEEMFNAWLSAFGKIRVHDRPAFMQKLNLWVLDNIL